jgi:hypothetical protein
MHLEKKLCQQNEHFMSKTVQDTTHTRSWRCSTTWALRATFLYKGKGDGQNGSLVPFSKKLSLPNGLDPDFRIAKYVHILYLVNHA